jgi:hypothetical protein
VAYCTELDNPVNFYVVVEVGPRRDQADIVCRLEAKAGDTEILFCVRTNLKKSGMVTFTPKDIAIVLVED